MEIFLVFWLSLVASSTLVVQAHPLCSLLPVNQCYTVPECVLCAMLQTPQQENAMTMDLEISCQALANRHQCFMWDNLNSMVIRMLKYGLGILVALFHSCWILIIPDLENIMITKITIFVIMIGMVSWLTLNTLDYSWWLILLLHVIMGALFWFFSVLNSIFLDYCITRLFNKIKLLL